MSAPQGWKLVPVEPTDAMLDASCLLGEINSGSLRGAWRDMLAAAPAEPAPVGAAIWQWLTADGGSICERWQAILKRWDGSDGRAGIEAAAVAAMQASGIGGKE